jgi:hypothetical protein
VLSLYKSLLRVVQTKPIENQPKLRNAVRTEFRHRVDIDRKGIFHLILNVQVYFILIFSTLFQISSVLTTMSVALRSTSICSLLLLASICNCFPRMSLVVDLFWICTQ